PSLAPGGKEREARICLDLEERLLGDDHEILRIRIERLLDKLIGHIELVSGFSDLFPNAKADIPILRGAGGAHNLRSGAVPNNKGIVYGSTVGWPEFIAFPVLDRDSAAGTGRYCGHACQAI
ncbi:MAG: hypothetical protein WCA20_08000, partial [Candidatus Sulfotelmatobacter sp.]